MTSPRIDETWAEVSYEGVAFPTVDFSTSWGNDSVLRQGLRTPGADIQTTGRKPFRIHTKIAFLNDILGWPSDPPLYPLVYESLMARFREIPIGILSHPTYGDLTVHVDEVHEAIDSKISNGFYVDVSFTEKTDPNQVFPSQADFVDVSVATPEQATAAQADEADALLLDLPGGSPIQPVPMSPIVDDLLAAINAGTVALLVADAAFGFAINLLNGNINLAVELGIAGHDYRASLERLRGSLYRFREEYLSSKKPKIYRVPTAMSLSLIAAQPVVYGDARKAYLLRINNSVPDPTRVPAGTLIQVLPTFE